MVIFKLLVTSKYAHSIINSVFRRWGDGRIVTRFYAGLVASFSKDRSKISVTKSKM